MENKVTIVCITYNHEKFIKQALESFIMQKTDFPFCAIVSDDCSTDSTPDIIKEYADKYPNIIKPVFHKSNMGVMKNYVGTLSLAKSKYVIVNEGDDYFTDENKLQKQADFLDLHEKYSACFHPVKIIYEGFNKKEAIFPSSKKIRWKNTIKLDELLYYNYIQTNSIMYRWRFNEENITEIFPEDIIPGDWYLHLLHAQKGDIAYLKDVMSVYRRHINGIWTSTMQNPEMHNLKYGLRETNFFYNVYKNISGSNDEYINSMIDAFIKPIINTYCKNGYFDELKLIKTKYPDIYKQAFEIKTKKKKFWSFKSSK